MKIDRITMNDESIKFETGTVKEEPNYQLPNQLEIILTGEKLPEHILGYFHSNELIDIKCFVKDNIFSGLFFGCSYSVDGLHRYELTLISSGMMNELQGQFNKRSENQRWLW